MSLLTPEAAPLLYIYGPVSLSQIRNILGLSYPGSPLLKKWNAEFDRLDRQGAVFHWSGGLLPDSEAARIMPEGTGPGSFTILRRDGEVAAVCGTLEDMQSVTLEAASAESEPEGLTPALVATWIKDMYRHGRARTKGDCADALGFTRMGLHNLEKKGGSRLHALAMAAALAGMKPYKP